MEKEWVVTPSNVLNAANGFIEIAREDTEVSCKQKISKVAQQLFRRVLKSKCKWRRTRSCSKVLLFGECTEHRWKRA